MLEVQSIAKTFNAGTPNEVRSLRGVSLTLEPGSWVIIIGTNGSGKSFSERRCQHVFCR
jgi:putative ABC transport system ATP-binding protein